MTTKPNLRPLWFYITALLTLFLSYMLYRRLASTSSISNTIKMSTKPSMENKNVFQKPLGLFSKQPITGFFRDGYCRTGPDDSGNHAIAGVLTKEFLDFTESRGNNLRAAGLEPGCKWCLCAGRWKEALEASKGKDDPVVPKVFLHATHESALQSVSLDDLKKYAHDGELEGQRHRDD